MFKKKKAPTITLPVAEHMTKSELLLAIYNDKSTRDFFEFFAYCQFIMVFDENNIRIWTAHRDDVTAIIRECNNKLTAKIQRW